MVAGAAAIGLHVLLLAALPGAPVSPHLDNGNMLAVLLIRPTDSSPMPASHPPPAAARRAVRKPNKAHERVRAERSRHAMAARPSGHPASAPSPRSVAVASATPSAQRPTQPMAQPVQGASLPGAARRRLLAHIVYPRIARRHGWEGRGLFRLDVHQRRIVRVAPLTSTGYRVLDRAVLEGLRDVARLDVADGWYRLPVEFRLQ
ncbi:MAG: hypothetical protein D6678_00415 [Zetaproteobacteria bacterium]|nr:MAG: hypothetical protein D6678_00415 [Zetaproteobacteria bacterium]